MLVFLGNTHLDHGGHPNIFLLVELRGSSEALAPQVGELLCLLRSGRDQDFLALSCFSTKCIHIVLCTRGRHPMLPLTAVAHYPLPDARSSHQHVPLLAAALALIPVVGAVLYGQPLSGY